VWALQDAQDKAVELGVAKPNAEKVDLESELKVAALPADCALSCCKHSCAESSKLRHCCGITCHVGQLINEVRARAPQRFRERVDIDHYENKPVPQMPE